MDFLKLRWTLKDFLMSVHFEVGVEFHISMARPSGRMLLEESGRSETHRILGILAAFTSFEKFMLSRTHQDMSRVKMMGSSLLGLYILGKEKTSLVQMEGHWFVWNQLCFDWLIHKTQAHGVRWMMNIWQGRFPVENLAEDGYHGISPVKARCMMICDIWCKPLLRWWMITTFASWTGGVSSQFLWTFSTVRILK